MSNSTNELIEYLEGEAAMCEETDKLSWQHNAAEIRRVAVQLKLFRDTLIKIAQCQNGMASHQAQEVLKETGHCYHGNQTYYSNIDRHQCHDCGRARPDRLVPYS